MRLSSWTNPRRDDREHLPYLLFILFYKIAQTLKRSSHMRGDGQMKIVVTLPLRQTYRLILLSAEPNSPDSSLSVNSMPVLWKKVSFLLSHTLHGLTRPRRQLFKYYFLLLSHYKEELLLHAVGATTKGKTECCDNSTFYVNFCL